MSEHRLTWEARRASRLFRFGAALETLAAIGYLTQWATDGTLQQPVQLFGAIAAIPLSVIMTIRWQRRAHWYATTEQWWKRLDEAPPILPLPRLHGLLDRRMTWTQLAALLIVPWLLTEAILWLYRG